MKMVKQEEEATAWFGPYPVAVIERREGEYKIHYQSYGSKYDEWVPHDRVQFVTSGTKRERAASKPPARGSEPLSSCGPRARPPKVERTQPAVPKEGDTVECFDVRSGWRRGCVGKQAAFGTIVHLGAAVEDEDDECDCLIQLPIDYQLGDVRYSGGVKAPSRELEGRPLLVPETIFGQDGEDAYAGVVKRVPNGGKAHVFFPVDGKELSFSVRQVRDWVVDDEDDEAKAEWEKLVPHKVPKGWPSRVLFCSFPVERGTTTTPVDQVLLKRKCALSEVMDGVEIRVLGAGHPCGESKGYNRGLFATRLYKRGHCLGQYAGCIQAPTESKTVRPTTGQYAISLDLAEGLSSSHELEIDAKYVGNESRFINDFRGVASRPNVQFKTVSHPGRGIWVDVIVVAAINIGDEILVDYGDDFKAYSNLTAVLPYDAEVVGRRLYIQWCGNQGKPWFRGRVTEWRQHNGTHLVVYDDGDEREHCLDEEETSGQMRWETSHLKRKHEELQARAAAAAAAARVQASSSSGSSSSSSSSRPPPGSADLFALGTVRTGEDGHSKWEVDAEWEERRCGRGRKYRRLQKRWVLKQTGARGAERRERREVVDRGWGVEGEEEEEQEEEEEEGEGEGEEEDGDDEVLLVVDDVEDDE